jgi:hypothetical protein
MNTQNFPEKTDNFATSDTEAKDRFDKYSTFNNSKGQ